MRSTLTTGPKFRDQLYMKLDMILTELGYNPTGTPPRLGVYLTNSLEEGEPCQQFRFHIGRRFVDSVIFFIHIVVPAHKLGFGKAVDAENQFDRFVAPILPLLIYLFHPG